MELTDTRLRTIALAITVVLAGGVLVLLAGPGRGARQDVAEVAGNTTAQVDLLEQQVALAADLVLRAERLNAQADVLLARAEQQVTRSDRLIQQADRLIAQADVLLVRAEQLVTIGQRQLQLSETGLSRLDESVSVQRQILEVGRATLQELRELNDKIPPPTGGSTLPAPGGAR